MCAALELTRRIGERERDQRWAVGGVAGTSRRGCCCCYSVIDRGAAALEGEVGLLLRLGFALGVVRGFAGVVRAGLRRRWSWSGAKSTQCFPTSIPITAIATSALTPLPAGILSRNFGAGVCRTWVCRTRACRTWRPRTASAPTSRWVARSRSARSSCTRQPSGRTELGMAGARNIPASVSCPRQSLPAGSTHHRHLFSP